MGFSPCGLASGALNFAHGSYQEMNSTMLITDALYQGMASAVPKKAHKKTRDLAPEGQPFPCKKTS